MTIALRPRTATCCEPSVSSPNAAEEPVWIMKKSRSKHPVPRLEDQLRAAAAKALSMEKVARAEKQKARSARRSYKQARKAFKQAKKAAKKAARRARQAQKELKTCLDNAAKAQLRTAMLARRAVARKPIANARPAAKAASKRKPMPPTGNEPPTGAGPDAANAQVRATAIASTTRTVTNGPNP